jgi:hypothetical protein
MTSPEMPAPDEAAESPQPDPLWLDQETLRDLDTPGSGQGDPQGGYLIGSQYCLTTTPAVSGDCERDSRYCPTFGCNVRL